MFSLESWNLRCGVLRTTLLTLLAKPSDDNVSVACVAVDARLQNIRALASPPKESWSNIVNLEFLQGSQAKASNHNHAGSYHYCIAAHM